ncbi:hypothetical protein EBZ37_07010 [bacterium]|nr:hypothetical protein [bacterium]
MPIALTQGMRLLTSGAVVFLFSISANAGECRVKALSITSDAPGFKPLEIGLVVDSRTLQITHLEFSSPSEPGGKKARVSSNMVETLSTVMNREMIDERLSFELDQPAEGLQQVRAQFGSGKFDVDVNPDWLPTFHDVFKVSGSFDSRAGARMKIDAQKGLNPFAPRTKIRLNLERHGPSCEDWHFYAVDGSNSTPVSGIVLKMNRIGDAIVGIDEITPLGFDPQSIQKLVDGSLRPASGSLDAMGSERKAKAQAGPFTPGFDSGRRGIAVSQAQSSSAL